MTVDELHEFDALSNDYEINWHLDSIRKKMNPTSKELKSMSVMVRNRRLAYLGKLIAEGQYFSEDAMREREPYLHHEYVGKFQDLTVRSMARPGERWSETLMRRSEEVRMVARIREEQQRLGVAERDWVGNKMMQKEEGEYEELEKVARVSSHLKEMTKDRPSIGDSNGLRNTEQKEEARTLSPLEMQDMMGQFTQIMQQKFLSREDHQYLNYSKNRQ